MGLPLVHVDAFSDRPFAGNPAAVLVLPEPRDDHWMQQVAAEMNLSETAFLLPRTDGFQLRWFTPTVEVDLCGHATLASAHVLWSEGHLPHDQEARFHTRSGLLTAQYQGDWIELNFPPKATEAITPPPNLETILGVPLRWVGQSGTFAYLVELASEEAVRTLQPDWAGLRSLPVEGVIVTSRATTPGIDLVSRFFAPQIGIDEDPVTGAAHCALAPFWCDRLQQTELVAYQASKRGGIVRLRYGRQPGDRVYLGGQAVTVLRGELQHF